MATLFSIATITLKAQIRNEVKLCESDSINGRLIHTVAEISPEYEGGLGKFYKAIGKVKLKDINNPGSIKVIVSFVVDVDGNIKNVCFSNNVEITQEVIESINHWTPGKIGGIIKFRCAEKVTSKKRRKYIFNRTKYE